MSQIIRGKSFVIGVCGGIAAYKCVELLRLLKQQDADVRVMMTANATRFVGPLTFEALSGRPVCTDLFDAGHDAAIQHIEWARAADAVVVAPATANMIGKLAHGIADDALSTFMLAVTAPVLVCPAMNTHMYQHPAVQRNLERLGAYGYGVLPPDSGELACGTTGPGRLPDPAVILDALVERMSPKDLRGKRVLVTAGPTRESMDPVRYISNPSSGKMGFAIARAARHRGAQVILVSGPTVLEDPRGVEIVRVSSAAQMAEAVLSRLDGIDIVIKAAAVSDYRPRETMAHKMKKGDSEITLAMERTQDILKEIGRRQSKPFLVGFAAETRDLQENAQQKLASKNLDMIAANIVGNDDSGFEADTNRLTLFFRDGHKEKLPLMEKEALAHRLLDRIMARISGGDR
jgi:phosphopantothenoylcysteine decarboxylase/phosphopantothenate--cysteine ligase